MILWDASAAGSSVVGAVRWTLEDVHADGAPTFLVRFTRGRGLHQERGYNSYRGREGAVDAGGGRGREGGVPCTQNPRVSNPRTLNPEVFTLHSGF